MSIGTSCIAPAGLFRLRSLSRLNPNAAVMPILGRRRAGSLDPTLLAARLVRAAVLGSVRLVGCAKWREGKRRSCTSSWRDRLRSLCARVLCSAVGRLAARILGDDPVLAWEEVDRPRPCNAAAPRTTPSNQSMCTSVGWLAYHGAARCHLVLSPQRSAAHSCCVGVAILRA